MHARTARAFSLVELIVVIGVIGALVGLLVPALGRFRAESDCQLCASNLRQQLVAIETYRTRSEGLLPPCEALPLSTPNGPEGGLPLALKGILEIDSPVHLCPRDFGYEWHGLGTSYTYLPGAAMLLVPINLQVTPEENELLASRFVTKEYEMQFTSVFPLVYDSEDRHTNTPMTPRNAVFLDGSVRKWGEEGAE
jgi:type II secretory pathway pseudopilin PulG